VRSARLSAAAHRASPYDLINSRARRRGVPIYSGPITLAPPRRFWPAWDQLAINSYHLSAFTFSSFFLLLLFLPRAMAGRFRAPDPNSLSTIGMLSDPAWLSHRFNSCCAVKGVA
jgi:hypothetical protein